jgi:DNA polymerase-1
MKLLSSAAVRRCLVADPGYSIISSDFDQIEWRILAAMSGEQSMIQAVKRGESIHKFAAARLFGEDYTPDQYGRTKNINFTYAFGGGAGKMASTYDIPFAEAQRLVSDYTAEFPALNKFKRKQIDRVLREALSPGQYETVRRLQSRMFGFRPTVEGRKAQAAIKLQINKICYGKVARIKNPFGRTLVVDAIKAYSVVNYLVQSTAAELMKHALIDVWNDPVLQPTVLLVIHDEILGQALKRDAQTIVDRLAKVMSREFMGVPITASGEVYGRSWGHGYLSEK